MSSLPSQHPTLSLHLTDLTLTPLITSSSSPTHLESLTSLTSSAITSQTTAQRANLGRPQRIMVEYPDSGAVVLQSYLDPRESGGGHSEPEPGSKYKHGHDHDHDADADADPDDATARTGSDDAAAPVLIGVVVAASSDDAREARRAAARLERIGREFQKEWAAQGLEQDTDGRSTPE
ncbi:hypothetical protein N5P37_001379 [Trichoderma harzianum]|uniref:Uncharacterized protein n=1 Tax=Trichoderma harzianum CBS 226.95 TaxID=983964 RepID=A0A2T4ARD6_TRIHA|nr:hypothetical protein M431DRAFT_2202 [Trichoderma harzianum CBS 226.95]KAK0765444.1 hypothetical protein N5P37_001379 [Trichoderma harzianum]PKK47959.1 hypothetical protein CI102_8014 [Trichoderma harzianum]PTB59624.1 hypothetical protein M431DRAFT_2202 [Trichoderma harzianum CBS 226.95]